MTPLADLAMYGQTPPTVTVRCFPDGFQDEGGHNPFRIVVSWVSVPGHIDVRDEDSSI